MKAYVDSREPAELRGELLEKEYSIVYSVKELPQGDFYLPEYDVVVERKEASDFASSTTDGRLSEQADRMIAEHEHVFLIIENELYSKYGDAFGLYTQEYSNIEANSITGMQTSLAVKRGIKIIYTESIKDTCYAVNRIFERFADEEHKSAESGYVKTADTGEVEDTQVAMLMQIDGISEEKARHVLNVISFDKIAYMSEPGSDSETDLSSRIQRVDGIGDKLADRIIKAFQ